MFLFKTVGAIAGGARRRMPWRLTAAGAFVVCAVGGFALGFAWATPGAGISTTIISGPVELDETRVVAQSPDHGVVFKTRELSDVYVVYNKIVPGGHTGWHSHPGISFVMVRAGTATEYHDDGANPTVYKAGTCLVEPAGRVHLIANEGNTDLELVAFQIIPFGATRRIDEDAP